MCVYVCCVCVYAAYVCVCIGVPSAWPLSIASVVHLRKLKTVLWHLTPPPAFRLPTLNAFPRCHAHTHALNPRHVKYDLLSGQMKPNSFAVCEAYKFIRRRRVSSGGQCGGQYGEGEVCMRARGHSKVNSKLANSQFENLQIRISHFAYSN